MSQDNTLDIVIISVALVTAVVVCDVLSEKSPTEVPVYRPIGRTVPTDIYGQLHNTPFFKKIVGIDEIIFDYIVDRLRIPLSKPRNIHFKYTDAENDARRKRKCNMSIENRLVAFLTRMKNGRTLWENAFQFSYNISSLSRDFDWIAINFDATLEPIWIRNLNQREKQASMGLIDGMYGTCYICVLSTKIHNLKFVNIDDSYTCIDESFIKQTNNNY